MRYKMKIGRIQYLHWKRYVNIWHFYCWNWIYIVIWKNAEKILVIDKVMDYYRPAHWGHSSVGRALAWHARGRRFESDWLHHQKSNWSLASFIFGWQSGVNRKIKSPFVAI